MSGRGVIRGVRVSGLACAVPQKTVPNSAFESAFGAEQMAKFEKMTGVAERRIAEPTESTRSLAAEAFRRLVAERAVEAQAIDAVVFVSQTPDAKLPATACMLQQDLGLRRDVIAFDVNLGCSGFVYGVFVASSLMKMEGVSNVLLCGGDTVSKFVDPSDPACAPLFGDAGFAMTLTRDETAPEIRYALMTDGSGRDNIRCSFGGTIQMDGMDVFNFTINDVPDLIRAEFSATGFSAESIDYLVLHQANKFVLKQVAVATGFSMKKVPISMDRYGNTSSASIPVTLCDLANAEAGMKRILASGFGVGLSWGTLIMDFDFAACVKL